MMALPAVRAVMSRPSRIGTPEASSVDSVRQNRATAILRKIDPEDRQLQQHAVDDVPAVLGGVVALERVARARRPPTMMNGMKRTSRLLAAMTKRVGSGSSAPRPANRFAKVGMTFHRIDADDAGGDDDDRDRIDHRRLDLALQLDGLLDVGRQPLENACRGCRPLRRRQSCWCRARRRSSGASSSRRPATRRPRRRPASAGSPRRSSCRLPGCRESRGTARAAGRRRSSPRTAA